MIFSTIKFIQMFKINLTFLFLDIRKKLFYSLMVYRCKFLNLIEI